MNKKLLKAIKIGIFSIATYLASYVTRNILSVLTPQMIQEDFFTKEYIGILSSACFAFYAIGQLINGFLGDRVHSKFMIAAGLGVSSIATITVPLFNSQALHIAAFALIGFGLSMLRGPLVKIISENTAPSHARMICTLFSMTGFAGPFIAGILSMLLSWRSVFAFTGVFSAVAAVGAFLSITVFEKNGEIIFTPKKTPALKASFRPLHLKILCFTCL